MYVYVHLNSTCKLQAFSAGFCHFGRVAVSPSGKHAALGAPGATTRAHFIVRIFFYLSRVWLRGSPHLPSMNEIQCRFHLQLGFIKMALLAF